MNGKGSKLILMIALTLALAGVILALSSCKKKEPAAAPNAPVEQASAELDLQKICPIMGNPINKDIYTEYKGKKVYFCCQECLDKFKAEPEKYLSKLPQFGN